jgi:hypothetical protein
MFPDAAGYGYSSALGLQQNTRTIHSANSHQVNHQTVFNTNNSRLGFQVDSLLPVGQARTNYQARDFHNFAFSPILHNQANNGNIYLPPELYPQGHTASQDSNWGEPPVAYGYPGGFYGPPPPPPPGFGFGPPPPNFGPPNFGGGNNFNISNLMTQITQILQMKVLLQNVTINLGKPAEDAATPTT